MTHFNSRINEYYLTIDSLLSALITAKEGNLTVWNHREKIKDSLNILVDELKFAQLHRPISKNFMIRG